jgi:hypothetical protein
MDPSINAPQSISNASLFPFAANHFMPATRFAPGYHEMKMVFLPDIRRAIVGAVASQSLPKTFNSEDRPLRDVQIRVA